jgi:hypothetical protein
LERSNKVEGERTQFLFREQSLHKPGKLLSGIQIRQVPVSSAVRHRESKVCGAVGFSRNESAPHETNTQAFGQNQPGYGILGIPSGLAEVWQTTKVLIVRDSTKSQGKFRIFH